MIKISYANTMKEELINYLILNDIDKISNIIINSNYKDFKDLNDMITIKKYLSNNENKMTLLNYLKDNQEGKKEFFLNGRNIRDILMYLGTEFFRNIDSNIHIFFEINKIYKELDSGKYKTLEDFPMLVSDDTRFENEALNAKLYNELKENSNSIEEFKLKLSKIVNLKENNYERNKYVFNKLFGNDNDDFFFQLEKKIKEIFIFSQKSKEKIKIDLNNQISNKSFLVIKRPIIFNKDLYKNINSVKDFFKILKKDNLEEIKGWERGKEEYMSGLQVSIDNYEKILKGLNKETNFYKEKEDLVFFLEQEVIAKQGEKKVNFKCFFNPQTGKLSKEEIKKKKIENYEKNSIKVDFDFVSIIKTLVEKTGYSRSDFTHPSEHLIYNVNQRVEINKPSQDGVDANKILKLKEEDFIENDEFKIEKVIEHIKKIPNDFKVLIGSAGTGKSVFLDIYEIIEQIKNNNITKKISLKLSFEDTQYLIENTEENLNKLKISPIKLGKNEEKNKQQQQINK